MREVAIEAARAAGAILLANLDLPKSYKFKNGDKYRVDPQIVSNVDREAETRIVEIIRRAYPAHNFLGEEAGQLIQGSDYTWIIDALDGTTQYLRRLPYFSLSIALQRGAEVILGVVYSPRFDELFIAERGAGAFLGDRRLRVSDVDDMRKALIASSSFESYQEAERTDVFSRVLAAVRYLRIYGSPAIDLCYVADGRLDARVTSRTMPWDHSAGCLIVEEAGGRVTDWNAQPWSPESNNLLVTNGRLHNLLLPLL